MPSESVDGDINTSTEHVPSIDNNVECHKAQQNSDGAERTKEAEKRLKASATLEDRITLLAALVGEREAAAAVPAGGNGGRLRAESSIPGAPVRLCHLLRELEEIVLFAGGDELTEASSLVQLRKLCLHVLTSAIGEGAMRRSYIVDTLAVAVLKASFCKREASSALELELACTTLLECAGAVYTEEEGPVGVLRRMSALKAAVDLTEVGLPMTRAIRRDFVDVVRRQLSRFSRQSVWVHVECRKNACVQLERLLRGGFLNDDTEAVEDGRHCVVNQLAEKEMSVQVRAVLFRCLGRFPTPLSDAMRSMCLSTLAKAPTSVADLESSMACGEVLCRRVADLAVFKKKLKGKGANNAAVMIAMARCGAAEDGRLSPLEALKGVLEIPGDTGLAGVVEGPEGDGRVFVKCCCALVWRACELGQAQAIVGFLMESLGETGAVTVATSFQKAVFLRLVEACMTATQGCIGGYQDEGWGDLIDVLMECITKEETAICATAASKALVAVLHEARCDPCFTKREFERLKSDAPRGDSPALDSAWRKRFSVCQLLGMLVPVSEGIEMVESMLGTAMEWLLDDGGDEGLVTSLLPRAACSLVLIEGCLHAGSEEHGRWLLRPRLERLTSLLDSLLGTSAMDSFQEWIITSVAVASMDEVKVAKACLDMNDRLVVLLLGQRLVGRVLRLSGSEMADGTEGVGRKLLSLVEGTMDLLKFLPSPLGPVGDSQPKLMRSLADRGLPDRLKLLLPEGGDTTGLRLLAELKCTCCDSLRWATEEGKLSGGPGTLIGGLMDDINGRVVPTHGGTVLLADLDDPPEVPPSDCIDSGAVMTMMDRGRSEEAQWARRLLRSIADTLAASLAVADDKEEAVESIVRSVLDGLPIVDMSEVHSGAQVVIPNDLRACVHLRTLTKLVEALHGKENSEACLEKMMALVEVALPRPLDSARLAAVIRLLAALAPALPTRTTELLYGVFDGVDSPEEALVNGCLAVDALADVAAVDVWEAFARSRSHLAYTTQPRLHYAVLSALRQGGTRALSLAVAHMVEESWDSRVAWEQLSRVVAACSDRAPNELSLTLLRSLELAAGEGSSEAVSVNLLKYCRTCIESNPELVQRLCRESINSQYYAVRRETVASLNGMAEKCIPVGAVEWGPTLVRMYNGSGCDGEGELCEGIDELVRSMASVQPRVSMDEAVKILGGLAMCPSVASTDATVTDREPHYRSRSMEEMRGRAMEDASSPVTDGRRVPVGGPDMVLSPRARALAVRLLMVVVETSETVPSDTNTPETLLRFALTLATTSGEATVGSSVGWNCLYLEAMKLLEMVLAKYSGIKETVDGVQCGGTPRLRAFEALVVPVVREALQASYNIKEIACNCIALCTTRGLVSSRRSLMVALAKALGSVKVDKDDRLVFDGRRGSETEASAAYFKCVVTLADCLAEDTAVVDEITSALAPHVDRLLHDCSIAIREASGCFTPRTFRSADYKILESSVRGPLANAAVVLAWLTGAVEGATGELCETILSGLLANSFPRLSGIILSSVVPAFIEKGVHEFEGAVEDWATAVGYGHMSHGQLEALTQFYDKFGGPGRIGCATECLRRSLMMEASIRALLAAGEVEAVVESPFPVDTVLVDRSTTMTEWQPEDLPSVVVTSVADRCMQKILTDRSLSKSDVEALLALLEKCPVSTLRDDGELQAKLQAVLEAVGEAPFNLEPPSGLCILSGLTNDGGDPSD